MTHWSLIGDVVSDDANEVPAALHQERIDHQRVGSAIGVDRVAFH